MKTCKDVAQQMIDYQLGELAESEVGEIDAHLTICPRCARFARTYMAIPVMVRAALEQELDEATQADLDRMIHDALAHSA